MNKNLVIILSSVLSGIFSTSLWAQESGHFRYPTISQGRVFFCAEGDIWTVSEKGGVASRVTTHPGEESHPVVSPDGSTRSGYRLPESEDRRKSRQCTGATGLPGQIL